MSGREVSGALFAFGVATLIGSKFGGFMTDRIGNPKTLVGGLIVHCLALILLSTIANSSFVAIAAIIAAVSFSINNKVENSEENISLN